MSEAEIARLGKLTKAQERVKVLDGILYQTFIDISEHFKIQLNFALGEIEKIDWEGWTEEHGIALFKFLEGLFSDENSILRCVQMFNLMVLGFKPDITWLDEIAEALKNAVTSLDNCITYSKYLMPQTG